MKRRFTAKRMAMLVPVVVAFAVGTFALFNPHVVLALPDYISYMQDQKFNWVDRSDNSLGGIIFAWLRAAPIALTLGIAITAALGLIVDCSSSGLPRRFGIAVLAFLLSTGLLYRGYLQPRFLIPIAPLACLYAAVIFRRLFQTEATVNRVLSVGGFGVIFLFSGWFCIDGITQRWHDLRLETSNYIRENVPKNASIALVPDSLRFGAKHHIWRYPPIDFNRYQIVSIFDDPDVLVVPSDMQDSIEAVIDSEQVDYSYRLDPRYRINWYRYSPPEPQLFSFYDELRNNRLPYRLIREWRKSDGYPIEFRSTGFRVYKRI